jgi:N-acetylglucosaminyldiphosphoundecaprenol N-acetyl-beta-D-mannosaminyltransferase
MAFLGGAPGVGARACEALNRGDTRRLTCVGAIDPGVVAAEAKGDPAIQEQVNSTGADFLLVALGAQKGQAWIMANRAKLAVPVVSHLGATLNFLAGTVRRAPPALQKLGLEWLWRIAQEPRLASRYIVDGAKLLWLLASRVVPLGLWLRWHGRRTGGQGASVRLDTEDPHATRVVIAGAAPDGQLEPVRAAFRRAAEAGRDNTVDVSGLAFFGMGFAGQLLMLEKAALRNNRLLQVSGAKPSVARALNWCGLGHLMRLARL